jgi:hypothetical protein
MVASSIVSAITARFSNCISDAMASSYFSCTHLAAVHNTEKIKSNVYISFLACPLFSTKKNININIRTKKERKKRN